MTCLIKSYLNMCMLAVGCLVLLAGCQAEEKTGSADVAVKAEATRPVPTEVPGVLRVGVSRNAPPIIFEEGGKTVGLEADFARALAKELGREVEFVPMFWPNLIYELQEKRIDIVMAGMSVTGERRRKVAFCEPYMKVGQKALIRKKDRMTLVSSANVIATKLRVGTESASTGEKFVKEEMKDARQFSFATLSSAIDALLDGNIDIVVYDSPSVLWELSKRSKNNSDELVAVTGLLTTENLAWAVNKENVELVGKANVLLSEWRDSGWLDERIGHWLQGR